MMVAPFFTSSKVDRSLPRFGAIPHICYGKLIVCRTADKTSYINYMKPLILAAELHLPHVISVIDTTDEWYYNIHPERYVPALKDWDAETQKEVTVFESTACLEYIADKFDAEDTWKGRNAWEKAQIMSWTAYQTAGLG